MPDIGLLQGPVRPRLVAVQAPPVPVEPAADEVAPIERVMARSVPAEFAILRAPLVPGR